MLRVVGGGEVPESAKWNSVCAVFFGAMIVLGLTLMAPEPAPVSKLVGKWKATPVGHVAWAEGYQFFRDGRASRNGRNGFTWELSHDKDLTIRGSRLGEVRGRVRWEGRDTFYYDYVYYDLKSERRTSRFVRLKK